MGQIFGKPSPKKPALVDQNKLAAATAPSGFPLPEPVHRSVTCTELPPGRIIIIGDVHGCYDELTELLQKVNYQEGQDAIVFVGDLVNKGPKSLEVLEFLERVNAFIVRGNHDDAALKAHRKLHNGEKVKAKFEWVQHAGPQHIEYLQKFPFSLCMPDLRLLVVHAGLVPGTAVEKQDLHDLFTMRDVCAMKVESSNGSVVEVRGEDDAREDGSTDTHRSVLWTASEEILDEGEGQPWASIWNGPYHVFFGHDAKRGLQQWKHATGLDTGCVYGKRLTACVLPACATIQQVVQQLPEGTAPTLEQLGAKFETVQARAEYEKKRKKKPEA